MKPYYEHAGITIYNGDCRDVLPTLDKTDLCLTDPPYGINLNTDNSRFSGGAATSKSKRGSGKGSARRGRIANDATPFDPTHLLTCASEHVIWGWNNYPDKLPPGACLVWLKRSDEAFGTFLSDAELAWMSKGHGVYCKREFPQSIAHQRVHPTQKPESIITWCLGFFRNAKTVIDPYMGSGTTLVAAKQLGMRAIGVELVERYCEIAAKRLSQEVLFGSAAAERVGGG